METPPIHVLLALDAQILGGEVGYGTSTPSTPNVQRRRHTNPVVDGQLVPRETKKRGRKRAAVDSDSDSDSEGE